MREVVIDTTGDIVVLECYTLRETGLALGKALLTIRSWLQNELIPAPILRDTGPGYPQFFRQELEAAAEILAEHEYVSKYLSREHTETIERLHEAMNDARAEMLDSIED